MHAVPPSGLGSGSDSGFDAADISGLPLPPTSLIPTAPTSLSSEADPPVTSPTSPQHSQHATCQVECDSNLMGSPENRRTPTASRLPPMRAVTFNGHQYNHLPAELADQLAGIPSHPTPHRRAAAAAPLVRFTFFFFKVLC